MGRGHRGGRRGGNRGRGRGQSSRGSSNHHKSRDFKKRAFSSREDSRDVENKRRRPDEQTPNQPLVADEPAESSSSESEEEVKPYSQLLSMFKSGNRLEQVVTDEETNSEDEEDELSDAQGADSVEGGEEESGPEDGSGEEEDTNGEDEPAGVSQVRQQAVEGGEEHTVDEDPSDAESEPEERMDTHHQHFQKELDEGLLEVLTSPKPYEPRQLEWKTLGRLVVQLPAKTQEPKRDKRVPLLGETLQDFASPGVLPVLKTGVPLKDYGVRSQLCANLDRRTPVADGDGENAENLLTPLQHELFTLFHNYHDVYYPEVNFNNIDEVRTVYCLHALNHSLKSRDKVLLHNSKLKKASESGSAVELEFRDQGLVRPRVLIVTALRNSAVKIVDKLASLLVSQKGQVINKQRFYNEYGAEKDETEAKNKPKLGDSAAETVRKNRKPEDHEAVFAGNTDDSFRLGISVSKRSLRLYSGFYMSDILVASSLGLRTLLSEDFDFLSSIEMLIMDQTDILYMQNWDHVLHIFQHLHLQPLEQHGTDLSRVRLWALNGHSAHYRQNLIFSSINLPEAAGLFSRRGTNFAGKVKVENTVAAESASVCRVVIQLPQAFHRFSSPSAAQAADDRFHFFTKKILPQYRNDTLMSNTLIFVASYYDYVRLRNFFHKESINFGQACEYTPDGKLAQVRNRFFLGKKRILLYTERLHFYRRLSIKGIHHIIFYQLPAYPLFYAELSNLLQDAFQSKKYRGDSGQTCTVVYSTFDAPRLAAVVGSQRAAEMLTSDRPVHLFVSGGS